MDRIPEFSTNGNLPAGVYEVTLDEVVQRFGWNDGRRELCVGLRAALVALASAGIVYVWIGGSFVTSKEHPNDVDGCWEWTSQVDEQVLDPVFLDLKAARSAMKKKYGVDFLIAGVRLQDSLGGCQIVEEFLQYDRDENRKGMIQIKIG